MNEWVREWLSGTWEENEGGLEWLRDRPTEIWKVMKRFPPTCVIQVLRSSCPGIKVGQCCIVAGYRENEDVLWIQPAPDAEMHLIPMEDVRVIGYRGGLTPARLTEILSDLEDE